jgi:hypothetical protein
VKSLSSHVDAVPFKQLGHGAMSLPSHVDVVPFKRLDHGAMSLPSHVGDGAAEVTLVVV